MKSTSRAGNGRYKIAHLALPNPALPLQISSCSALEQIGPRHRAEGQPQHFAIPYRLFWLLGGE